LSSSIGFFALTNAAVWAFSPWYEKSLAGLLYCYTLALPFFKTMLYGDLVYGFVLLVAPCLYAKRHEVIRAVSVLKIRATASK
jgi:hypothetical protein